MRWRASQPAFHRRRHDPLTGRPKLRRHGNPNVLTADRPSSTLSQGCTGQLTLVEIEPYHGVPPELSVTQPPATAHLE